jgi:Xaa-Pro dipeptidase
VSSQTAILWYASFSPLPTQLPCQAEPMRGLASVRNWLENHHDQTEVALQLAIDHTNLTVAEFRQLSHQSKWEITDLDRAQIWHQRMIKDSTEIATITLASQITSQVFTTIQTEFVAGMTEQMVAHRIDELIRAAGAKPAFPTIVAFGAHSALPHHQPTATPLTAETAVLVDFGAQLDSYCSDFTRTWWFGTHSPTEFQTVAEIIRSAYKAGIEVVAKRTPTTTAADVDSAVRQTITKAGFGDSFIHTTGHGLGLEIHEPPSLSQSNKQLLQTNMAITIEPGIYLPEKFGYRFENTVIIGEQQPIIIT